MLTCWTCKNILPGEPDIQPYPIVGDEEEFDLVATCPECLTRHIYVEDESGNLIIIEAMDTNDRVLHSPAE